MEKFNAWKQLRPIYDFLDATAYFVYISALFLIRIVDEGVLLQSNVAIYQY